MKFYWKNLSRKDSYSLNLILVNIIEHA